MFSKTIVGLSSCALLLLFPRQHEPGLSLDIVPHNSRSVEATRESHSTPVTPSSSANSMLEANHMGERQFHGFSAGCAWGIAVLMLSSFGMIAWLFGGCQRHLFAAFFIYEAMRSLLMLSVCLPMAEAMLAQLIVAFLASLVGAAAVLQRLARIPRQWIELRQASLFTAVGLMLGVHHHWSEHHSTIQSSPGVGSAAALLLQFVSPSHVVVEWSCDNLRIIAASCLSCSIRCFGSLPTPFRRQHAKGAPVLRQARRSGNSHVSAPSHNAASFWLCWMTRFRSLAKLCRRQQAKATPVPMRVRKSCDSHVPEPSHHAASCWLCWITRFRSLAKLCRGQQAKAAPVPTQVRRSNSHVSAPSQRRQAVAPQCRMNASIGKEAPGTKKIQSQPTNTSRPRCCSPEVRAKRASLPLRASSAGRTRVALHETRRSTGTPQVEASMESQNEKVSAPQEIKKQTILVDERKENTPAVDSKHAVPLQRREKENVPCEVQRHRRASTSMRTNGGAARKGLQSSGVSVAESNIVSPIGGALQKKQHPGVSSFPVFVDAEFADPAIADDSQVKPQSHHLDSSQVWEVTADGHQAAVDMMSARLEAMRAFKAQWEAGHVDSALSALSSSIICWARKDIDKLQSLLEGATLHTEQERRELSKMYAGVQALLMDVQTI